MKARFKSRDLEWKNRKQKTKNNVSESKNRGTVLKKEKKIQKKKVKNSGKKSVETVQVFKIWVKIMNRHIQIDSSVNQRFETEQ